MDAAERLVAERGLHGVRVAEVVKAAGHKNNSAVSYHFGSWQGLLEAVWQRHTEPVSIDRAVIIAGAVDRGDYDLPTMVEAYVRPLVAELGRHQPSYWARFNEQWLATIALDIFTLDDAAVARQPRAEAMTVVHNLFIDIADTLTHLEYPARTRRVALMARYVIAALAAWEREGESAQALTYLEHELISTTLALLQAP
ncbi:helix-turn-helix domain-containing protein [Rhodococcus sp. NPDC003348]